ncbi:MAG: 30S ribosomal protein S9 [Pseudomonadota bacterium]
MAQKKNKESTEFWATGKRKTAIARVKLTPGSGKVTVNSKEATKYFGRDVLQIIINQPFEATGTEAKFDITANITGGGPSGQCEALRHGISRALLAMNPDLRKPLRGAGLLTRDPREKERRKVGCRKARRRPQYSKR